VAAAYLGCGESQITWQRFWTTAGWEVIHQHPELGDQQTRTARLVAEHLRDLGLEVPTKMTRTGVVGILKGAKPGHTVALRADMDALPIKEPEGLPFASQAKAQYLGKEVDAMYACGHDAHTAMLMATAEVLADMQDELPGRSCLSFNRRRKVQAWLRPIPAKVGEPS
jgi:amidohydrolase